MAPPEPKDRGSPVVDRVALAALAEDFPALAHVLGPRRFRRLGAEVLGRARETGRPPGSYVERVVVDHMLRLRSRKAGSSSSRLAADVAALEWARLSVAHAPPRDTPPLCRADLPAGEALAGAVLEPIDALRLVPVAFALGAYLRRVSDDRRPPLPRRADHTLLVARPRSEPVLETLTRGEGRLLNLLCLGTPVGEALATAQAQGWTPDATSALASLHQWVGSGFFAEVHPGAPAVDTPPAY